MSSKRDLHRSGDIRYLSLAKLLVVAVVGDGDQRMVVFYVDVGHPSSL